MFLNFFIDVLNVICFQSSFGILPLTTPVTNNQDLDIQSSEKSCLKKVILNYIFCLMFFSV